MKRLFAERYAPLPQPLTASWTTSKLQSYNKDPRKMYPGTAMPGDLKPDRWQRRELVEYLATTE